MTFKLWTIQGSQLKTSLQCRDPNLQMVNKAHVLSPAPVCCAACMHVTRMLFVL